MNDMQRAIRGFLDSQPPQWQLGVNAAQELLSTWVKSDEEATKGFASMLLSYSAFVKMEGYTAGMYSLLDAIKAHVEKAGNDTPVTVLLEALNAERERVDANMASLYGQVFSALVGSLSDQAPTVPNVTYFEPAFKRFFTELHEAYMRNAAAH